VSQNLSPQVDVLCVLNNNRIKEIKRLNKITGQEGTNHLFEYIVTSIVLIIRIVPSENST